jgi:hypothetical protein
MTNCVTIRKLNSRPEPAMRSLADKVYTDIYVGRTFNLDGEGNWNVFHEQEEYLNEEIFELETVAETIIEPGVIVRFDRIAAVHLPEPAPESPADGEL